ncbi:MAG: hypothetical protein AB9873_17930 [Syntrophobacteraceae bacterium]
MTDSIIKRYAAGSLPVQEAARVRCLPEKLPIKQIVYLWVGSDRSKFGPLCEAIRMAVKRGHLKGEGSPDPWVEVQHAAVLRSRWMSEVSGQLDNLYTPMQVQDDGYGVLIHRDDFRDWLKSENEWPLADCLLLNWWEPDARLDQGEDPTATTGSTAQIDEATLALARRLLPTVGTFYEELKLLWRDDEKTPHVLQRTALDLLEEDEKRFSPIRKEHLRDITLFSFTFGQQRRFVYKLLSKIIHFGSYRKLEVALKDKPPTTDRP